MKNVIIISAINIFEGGALSVLKDSLRYLNKQERYNVKIIALVHRICLFEEMEFTNIDFVEFPKSRQSYFYRLYYEYFHFKQIARKYDIRLWLSMHDITPNVGRVSQAVYCHNSIPFYSSKLSDLFVQPKIFFFSLFYKYLYRINIHKNTFVIVQQLWMKNKFHEIYKVPLDKIIVAKPQSNLMPFNLLGDKNNEEIVTFIYPTFPRVFKNIEIICEAVKLLNEQKCSNFNVKVTIDGTENKYSELIYKKYNNIKNIDFIGLQSRERVNELYSVCDCLIFPSKLETWGLPISEVKQFSKIIVAADLPYAKETVGKYDKAYFFNPSNAGYLAKIMKSIILQTNHFDKTEEIKYPKPVAEDWEELFAILLK